MRYTVKKLAELSGVTVRTLHHYDRIGLLQPAYCGENNYRYYEEDQLLLLQQILFYREMGMPLKDIKKVLLENFNAMRALKVHRGALTMELDRLKKMIQTIDKTIKHLEGEICMKDEELFFGLDSPRQKKYERFLVEKGVCTEEEIEASRERAKKVDWDTMKKKWDQLFKDYVDAIQKNLKPASPEVQKIVRNHLDTLQAITGGPPSKEYFLGLIQQYHSHPDWLKMFSSYHPKLLDYLSEAMDIFAHQSL